MSGDCEDAVHRLYHFLDGELDDARRAEIKHHLDDCLPCLEAFDFEAELRIVIAQRCRDEVPEGLRDRIAQAIQHEHLRSDHGRGDRHGGGLGGGGIPKL